MVGVEIKIDSFFSVGYKLVVPLLGRFRSEASWEMKRRKSEGRAKEGRRLPWDTLTPLMSMGKIKGRILIDRIIRVGLVAVI